MKATYTTYIFCYYVVSVQQVTITVPAHIPGYHKDMWICYFFNVDTGSVTINSVGLRADIAPVCSEDELELTCTLAGCKINSRLIAICD